MSSSKSNGGPRPKLSSTPSSGAPTPSVTNIYAAGESVSKSSHSTRPNTATSTRRVRNPSVAQIDGSADAAKRSSWFSRKGTWPKAGQKSVPIAQVAHENASGESLATQPDSDEDTRTEFTVNASAVSLPVMKTASKATVTAAPVEESPVVEAPPAAAPDPPPVATAAQTAPEESSKDDAEPEQPIAPPTDTIPRGSWLNPVGWWYGQPVPANAAAVPEPELELPKEPEIHVQEEAPVEPETPNQPPTATDTTQAMDDTEHNRTVARRSWFGLWGGSSIDLPESGNAAVQSSESLPQPVSAPAEPAAEAVPPPPEPPVSESGTSTPNINNNRGSYGWAFWSKAGKYSDGASMNDGKSTMGEIAIAGDVTESSPQIAKLKVSEGTRPALKSTPSTPVLRNDSRPSTPKLSAKPSDPKTPAQAKDSSPKKPENGSATSLAPAVNPRSSSLESSAARKKLEKILPKNHLLPTFESCYQYQDQPSIIQSVTKYFKTPRQNKDHLYISRQPPKIKKAVAIGVHGFFPMRLVRTVLGEPTGTSIKFANHAANSIKRWAEKNGFEVEVEKIALEGEGKVADRVDMLWKLLQNWMDHVRSADFVLMAAHSQGVVVGMELLSRMIEEGCVEKARIGFTAMAGINLGPFGHLPTTLLTGSAKELFEFQKQNSTVSKNYVQALKTVVAHNVRILYVGSIDDQLVPLESSTMTNISHPHIYRAVFVDGRVHAPDFLSHLVGFAMKLRNRGVPDHGLIRELSTPLAGSLYGGEGHSRIYDDGCVYDLGVRHALETTTCDNVTLKIEPFELPTNSNPYFLPWSMRGLLEENYVRTHLHMECMELLDQFENWKPTSKTLKDVKFRLEGIRSKL